MKRKSHSHSIPGIISKDHRKESKDKENVDVILEGDEEEDERDEIGILLKKPSMSQTQTQTVGAGQLQLPIRLISPSQNQQERFQRIRSLGVPSQNETGHPYDQSPLSMPNSHK